MELIDLLRERTSDVHRALEGRLVGRIKSLSSPEDYGKLLRLMYGFYAAMESRIQPIVEGDPVLDFPNRRKALWLIHDMDILGDTSDLRRCQQLPSISNASAALGAMYVLEGSTLGGQHIARMVKKNLGISDEALSFFHSYKGNTTMMWERFKQVLTKPFNADEQREIVNTAQHTFATFINWINTYDAAQL